MNIRQLALRLATVDAGSRKELLAMLPTAKKALLRDALQQALPMVASNPEAFERVLSEIEAQSDAYPVFDRDSLRVALNGESHAITQQMPRIFVEQREGLVSSHVRSLLAEYLAPMVVATPASNIPKRKWWHAKLAR
jgi:hypothetical protein